MCLPSQAGIFWILYLSTIVSIAIIAPFTLAVVLLTSAGLLAIGVVFFAMKRIFKKMGYNNVG